MNVDLMENPELVVLPEPRGQKGDQDNRETDAIRGALGSRSGKGDPGFRGQRGPLKMPFY